MGTKQTFENQRRRGGGNPGGGGRSMVLHFRDTGIFSFPRDFPLARGVAPPRPLQSLFPCESPRTSSSIVSRTAKILSFYKCFWHRLLTRNVIAIRRVHV